MAIYTIGVSLLNSIALMFLITFLLSRTNAFKNLILNKKNTFKNKIFLAIVFSFVGIFGTYYGFPIEGAIANSRAIGIVVAGLLGGPFVGISAGFIAGFHRWAIDIGGFTAFACMISTVLEGILGGIAYKFKDRVKEKWILGFYTTVLAELLQMAIVLIVAQPYDAAIKLVSKIIIPMTLMNSLGAALFIILLENIFKEQEREAAAQSELSLKIADNTLPILRNGINKDTATATCKIIYSIAKVDAVAITKGSEILAHIGIGSDHHLPGKMIQTAATKTVLETKKSIIVDNKHEIECKNKNCKLSSAIIVPLFKGDKVIGVLKIYKAKKNGISSIDVQLAEGLAKLFSTQIELAEIDNNAKLLSKAEFKALQAQINPHFLFNALNTIVSMIRINPEMARKLLINLGNFLRESFKEKEDIVDIVSELKHVEAYLEIEKARFGERINVIYNINSSNFKIPHLILQPLVENAVKHGICPKKEGGTISIIVDEDENNYILKVDDNGIGFDNTIDNPTNHGIGMKNIDQRLKSIYGSEFGLKIESEKGLGTKVLVNIPKRGV